jgi:hypothetical protein
MPRAAPWWREIWGYAARPRRDFGVPCGEVYFRVSFGLPYARKLDVKLTRTDKN